MGYTYVMSDLHGHYCEFQRMLEVIGFCEEDMLYILGDVVDRGPEPVRLLLDLMDRPNVVCLVGNHELMACDCLRFLLQEITEENIVSLNEDAMAMLLDWQDNGADSTLKELRNYPKETQLEIYDFITDFEVFEELWVNQQRYLLVHAGLMHFDPERDLYDYGLEELVWERPDYSRPYFADTITITGHTPTQFIPGHPHPGYIYRGNQHIAIDCGCSMEGGRLGCLRLEDGKEFYVERL